MLCKCLDCGHVFTDNETERYQESRGECFGFASFETCGGGCPKCDGEYEEEKMCQICGDEYFPSEMNARVCDFCIDSCKHDWELCYRIARNGDDDLAVFLNSFLATMFTTSQIEEILLEHLKKADSVDCSEFIERDRHWFAERLAEEVKNDEH